MLHNSPSQETIVEIANIPTRGNSPKESITAARAISSFKHANILLIRRLRALPGDTLKIGRVE
jgi:hypothetical protein